jgi:predicted DNA-binding protein (MmcQ/YjbR family)
VTVDVVRSICRAFPGVTEDIKWGSDLAFSVGGKMFCVVNVELPHQMSFKCTADGFAELVEREGLIPAPYLARAMWVQQESLESETLGPSELKELLRTSYELVLAKLPRSKRPGTTSSPESAPRRDTRRSARSRASKRGGRSPS